MTAKSAAKGEAGSGSFKAAQKIWHDDSNLFDLPTDKGLPKLAAIIENETHAQALYEALSALWAGVSDARRKSVGTGANNPELLIQLPVLWGAIEKMAAALALADAAQEGEAKNG